MEKVTQGDGAGLAYRSLISMAAVVVIIAGLRAASPLLLPVLVAAFLVVLSIPPINWLKNHRVPTWAAGLLVFSGVLAGLVFVSVFVGASIREFTGNLDEYAQGLEARTTALVRWVETTGGRYGVSFDISTARILQQLDTERMVGMLGEVAGAFTAILSNTVFVLITIIFMLAEAAGLPEKIEIAAGGRGVDLQRWSRILNDLQGYLAIKTLVSIATGTCVTLLLFILGVDYPVLWGLVAFLLNYIPNLGSIIAGIPPTLLALVQFGAYRALAVAAGFTAINMLIGNFLDPRLMGRRVGLSTLVVFLSLVFWAYVFGPVGMVLCVPLTMLVKLLLDRSDETRWIAVLLSSSAELRERATAAKIEPEPPSGSPL